MNKTETALETVRRHERKADAHLSRQFKNLDLYGDSDYAYWRAAYNEALSAWASLNALLEEMEAK